MSQLDRSHPPQLADVQPDTFQQVQTRKLDNGIPVHTIDAGFQDLVRIEFTLSNRVFDPQQALLPASANRLITEGTSERSALQIAEAIDSVGAFLETEETADTNSVVLYTLNKHLPFTLPIVKEVLTDASYPESEVSLYITRQKQRLAIDDEKVNAVARRRFNQILFGDDNPYGHFVVAADYDRLNQGALADYHSKSYIPSNLTVMIAGKVVPDLYDLLNLHFGSDAGRSDNRMAESLGSMASSSQREHFFNKDGALQSALRVGRRIVGRSHEDYPGLTVLNTILGGYFGSRLMSNIREDKGYTYGIGSAVVPLQRDGYFFISTEVGAEVTKPALEEIYKEIEILHHELVEVEELSMVRNYLKGTFLKGIDGPFALMDRFKSIWLNGLDYSYYERYLSTLNQIGPTEIRELARKYLKKEDLFELVVGVK